MYKLIDSGSMQPRLRPLYKNHLLSSASTDTIVDIEPNTINLTTLLDQPDRL